MTKKKKKFDAVFLLAIITTTFGILGGLSFASLPYVNFSNKVDGGTSGNASSLNLLSENFITKAFTGDDNKVKPSLQGAIEYILSGWVAITATLAVAGLVVGAFMYITAHGNEDQLNKAKQTIGLTLLGLIIASLAYLIVRLVVSVFY